MDSDSPDGVRVSSLEFAGQNVYLVALLRQSFALLIGNLLYTSLVRRKIVRDEANSGHSCTVETCEFNYFAPNQNDPLFSYSLFDVSSEVQSMQVIVNFSDRVFTLTYAY